MSGDLRWLTDNASTFTGANVAITPSASTTFTPATWSTTATTIITTTATTGAWVSGNIIQWDVPPEPKPMRQGWLFDDYPEWR